MQKKTFIILFIGMHVIFILLQVHKQSYAIQLSYLKQKNDKIKQELIDKRKILTQEYYAMQNKSSIKKFAQQELGMKKISLKQVKQLTHESSI
ncbi:MAG: hypothetical protein WDZ41_02285 [Candidatus Babeliales bacterium]